MTAIALQVEWQMAGGPAEPNLVRLATAFERAGAELAQVGKHVLPQLLPLLETETAKQFDAEGAGPQAGSWAPLSVSYSAWKQAHYGDLPKLVLTGAMRSALTESNAPGALREVSGDSLAYGTKGVPYASFHQMGTGRMPARPPFDFGPDFENGMRGAAMKGIRAAVREAFDGLADFEGTEFEGQAVLTGRKGGRYIQTGKKREYLKVDASGRVVRKSTFGKKAKR